MANNQIQLIAIAKEILVIMDDIFDKAGTLKRPKHKLRNTEGCGSISHEILHKSNPRKRIECQIIIGHGINDNDVTLVMLVGREIVKMSIYIKDLTLCIEEFSEKYICPMVNRLQCVIAARQRQFKLRKMKAKSKERQFNAPWLNRKMVLV